MLRIVLVMAASVAAQTYENKNVGGRYTAPAGWAFETPAVDANGIVTIRPTRPGLIGRPVISFWKTQTEVEAFLVPGAGTFTEINGFFKNTDGLSIKAPSITYIQDTIIGQSYFTFLVIRQADRNLERVVFSGSTAKSIMSFSYSTTIEDNQTNRDLYLANWMNMAFIPASPVAAKGSVSLQDQEAIRKGLIDLLGRTLRSPSSTPRVKIPLP